MPAGIASPKLESWFSLPADVTNRIAGALANACVSALREMSKYSRAICLRSSGVLPMPQS